MPMPVRPFSVSRRNARCSSYGSCGAERSQPPANRRKCNASETAETRRSEIAGSPWQEPCGTEGRTRPGCLVAGARVDRPIAETDGARRMATPAREAHGPPAGGVVEPDAVAEQHRSQVDVDLVDQAQMQKLFADSRREHFDVLPAGGLKRDPHRLLDRAAEERDALRGTRVLGMVGEYEDRPVPLPAVRARIANGAVIAVPPRQYGAR